MAGSDGPPQIQKQLLTLIRDFASERSRGERRVVNLEKRIEELRSELDAANAELEEAKRFRETAEQDLKGCEVALALNDASIHTLDARISLIQDEITSAGSEVERLKDEVGALRDKFIRQMFDFNTRIRYFQGTRKFYRENSAEAAPGLKFAKEVATEVDSGTLEDKLACIVSQTNREEQEYLDEQNIRKQQLENESLWMSKPLEDEKICGVEQDYVELDKKVSLAEMVMKETKALRDLTRQTSELEQTCASLTEDLQKRCICPGCHLDNLEALGGILKTNEAK